ncbi:MULTISPECIES: hypothetical protein [Erysipelothrix]|uniref:hypothetical protein n=1 Tax=Erysipelothrix TaxID=1647 RepID=UPI00140C16D9|nr:MULTISPECIES: hypothetical protein [Erysipelothrix]MDV7678470.1 hypothetical protein [Erysipelothrix rhusiopathiae]WMT70170.1 hypothetical protein K0H77_01270 [Erysipelothrix rhusiopathiae]
MEKETVRIRVTKDDIELIEAYYQEKGQTFSSPTKMINHLIATINRNNFVQLHAKSDILDETIREILDANMHSFSSDITKMVAAPLREQSIQMTMANRMLASTVYLGLTDNEIQQKMIEHRKQAVAKLHSEDNLLSLNDLESE